VISALNRVALAGKAAYESRTLFAEFMRSATFVIHGVVCAFQPGNTFMCIATVENRTTCSCHLDLLQAHALL
jgi:hypothetical protein